jgi:hypothetical protein
MCGWEIQLVGNFAFYGDYLREIVIPMFRSKAQQRSALERPAKRQRLSRSQGSPLSSPSVAAAAATQALVSGVSTPDSAESDDEHDQDSPIDLTSLSLLGFDGEVSQVAQATNDENESLLGAACLNLWKLNAGLSFSFSACDAGRTHQLIHVGARSLRSASKPVWYQGNHGMAKFINDGIRAARRKLDATLPTTRAVVGGPRSEKEENQQGKEILCRVREAKPIFDAIAAFPAILSHALTRPIVCDGFHKVTICNCVDSYLPVQVGFRVSKEGWVDLDSEVVFQKLPGWKLLSEEEANICVDSIPTLVERAIEKGFLEECDFEAVGLWQTVAEEEAAMREPRDQLALHRQRAVVLTTAGSKQRIRDQKEKAEKKKKEAIERKEREADRKLYQQGVTEGFKASRDAKTALPIQPEEKWADDAACGNCFAWWGRWQEEGLLDEDFEWVCDGCEKWYCPCCIYLKLLSAHEPACRALHKQAQSKGKKRKRERR